MPNYYCCWVFIEFSLIFSARLSIAVRDEMVRRDLINVMNEVQLPHSTQDSISDLRSRVLDYYIGDESDEDQQAGLLGQINYPIYS